MCVPKVDREKEPIATDGRTSGRRRPPCWTRRGVDSCLHKQRYLVHRSFNLISLAWPSCKGYSPETSEPNYAIKGSGLITDNTFYLLRLPTPGGRCGLAHAHRRRDETVVTAHIRSRCRNTAIPCSQSRFIPGSLRRLVPHSRLVDSRWSIRRGRGIRMRLCVALVGPLWRVYNSWLKIVAALHRDLIQKIPFHIMRAGSNRYVSTNMVDRTLYFAAPFHDYKDMHKFMNCCSTHRLYYSGKMWGIAILLIWNPFLY